MFTLSISGKCEHESWIFVMRAEGGGEKNIFEQNALQKIALE